MSRQNRQTAHEAGWAWVHPAIRDFFNRAIVQYVDTSKNQDFIGARAAAYSQQMLPIYAVKGPGEVTTQQLIATSPQVFVQQTTIPTGIAGIGAGQIWNGGLTDNTNQGPVV